MMKMGKANFYLSSRTKTLKYFGIMCLFYIVEFKIISPQLGIYSEEQHSSFCIFI